MGLILPPPPPVPGLSAGFWEDQLPYGFGWNRSTLDVRFGRAFGKTYGSAINPAALIPAAVWAAPLATQIFHVDPVNGSDTSGTGIGNYLGDFTTAPVKTLTKAITLANATSTASRILINGATNPALNRAASGIGTSTYPTVSMAIEAMGGRVTLAATDAHTWAVDGTYTNCYSASEGNTSGAIDLLNQRWLGDDHGARLFDRNGIGRQSYIEFVPYASAAALNSATLTGTTGGGYFNSGTTVYVRRADGAAVTDANTRTFRGSSTVAAPAFSTGGTSYSGSCFYAGIDFQGGWSSNGPGTRNAWLHECRAMYSTMQGGYGGVGGNGFQWDASGAVLYTNCESWCNGTDCFNVHGTNGLSQQVCVDCLGWDTGRAQAGSCNGITGHEHTMSIDLNGDYQLTRGGMARFIDQSRCLLYGSRLLIDLGDGAPVSPVLPTTVEANANAQMWTMYCAINSTLDAFVTDTTAHIYTRGNTVLAGATVGSGTVAV